LWAAPEGRVHRRPGAMQSDDLFIRKIRRHSNRPPLTSLSFDTFRAPKGRRPPRARAHSHEEQRASSPTARRFRDPLLLLGLAPTEEAERPGNVTTGASAASQSQQADGACPRFRVEAGGEVERGLGQHRGPLAGFHCPNMAVSVLEEPRESYGQRTSRTSYAIEYADLGACYYRKHFYGKEHQNYFGIDDQLGAVAVSLRREEKEGTAGPQYNYRLIIRTSQLRTLRGSILEDAVPLAARHTSPRGISPKKLLEHVMPELNLQCFRLASNSPKVPETLLKLDEQGLSFQRKVGVLYCLAGQSSEEDMYNNENAGPTFQEFLNLLGDRVCLRGFDKYRAQLDTKNDSTGTHSLYTMYQDYEIMFHVSTMLPYTPNNQQQLLRKRHIGNDIVTIIFQEPGALPFTPCMIRSQFQHVFIVVRMHESCMEQTTYSVAVSCTEDIPPFGPFIPAKNCFVKGPAFRDLLLAKAINAENAAERSGKFHAMATRTRQEYLRDLALNHVTTSTLEASSTRLALMALAAKKREKSRAPKGAEAHSAGALVWGVWARDGCRGPDSKAPELRCLLGISAEFLVLIDAREKRVVFNCSCRDILAWTFSESCTLDLYYETGDYICMRVEEAQASDIRDIVHRLQLVTRGCETRELTLLRNGVGQLGFQMDHEGFVTEVERFTFAEKAGLQPGARLVRVCERALPSLSHPQTSELLRMAKKVTITVVPPDENGKPRRSFSELYQKSLQEKRRSEPPAGEAELTRPGSEAGFKPATLQLLHSLSLQDGPPHSLAEERTEFLRSPSKRGPPCCGRCSGTSPAATSRTDPARHRGDGKRGRAEQAGLSTRPGAGGAWLSRAEIRRGILSEASESLEDEWDSIAGLASTCNSILEALSREGGYREAPLARAGLLVAGWVRFGASHTASLSQHPVLDCRSVKASAGSSAKQRDASRSPVGSGPSSLRTGGTGDRGLPHPHKCPASLWNAEPLPGDQQDCVNPANLGPAMVRPFSPSPWSVRGSL
uniref:Signal-induced proliferation-associated 1 n=1 Tax=Varanus komodoensis TaxID=61221 RepID=A0A8D2LH22_VARKO